MHVLRGGLDFSKILIKLQVGLPLSFVGVMVASEEPAFFSLNFL